MHKKLFVHNCPLKYYSTRFSNISLLKLLTSNRISDIAHSLNVKLLVWGGLREQIQENLRRIDNGKIEYINFENGIKNIDSLMGTPVISTDCLLRDNRITGIHNGGISVDKALLLLDYGLYPAVSVSSNAHDILSDLYGAQFVQYSEDLSILKSIDIGVNMCFGKNLTKHKVN